MRLRRGGKNALKNCTKIKDRDRDDACVTHVKPDKLEHEVKRTLGSITRSKASGGNGITAELFKTS